MFDEIKLVIGDNGEAKIYDDTYDIVIHCESKEEQDKAIKKLNSMNWIPCSERLPDNDDRVICTVQTKAGVRNVIRGYFAPEVNRWVCGMNSNVIAWMPMPDPYEPKEGAK